MAVLNKEQEAFLNDFNWHNYAEGIDAVDQKNLEEFENLNDITINDYWEWNKMADALPYDFLIN